MVDKKRFWEKEPAILTIVIIGLLSCGLIIFMHLYSGHVLNEQRLLIKNIHGVQLKLNEAHLILEEHLSGDAIVSQDLATATLKEAESYLTELKENKNITHNPLLDQGLTEMGTLIRNLLRLTDRRIFNYSQSGIGTKADEQYDLVFEKARVIQQGLERYAEEHVRRMFVTQNSVQYLVLFIWVSAVALAGLKILTHSRKRKEAEDALATSEHKYRHIFQHASDYILVLEPREEGPPVIVDGSDSAFAKHGYSREELIGKPISIIDPNVSEKVVAERLKIMKEKEGGFFEVEHVCKDGSRFTAEVSGKIISSGGKPLIYTIERDITERKRNEEKLKKAKDEAEEATKLKDKFVSLASHDLKSPLSSMVGFLKLVRDDTAEPLNEGAKMILSRAIESGLGMAKLIDDLLNISKLKTGYFKLNREFFDARYIGVKISADFSFAAEQKGISLKNEIPENSRIYADKVLLSEAIQNLVSNAIKFCKNGDVITISIGGGNKSHIYVTDTGPGISREMLDNIFEYIGGTSLKGTAGETGTGLGLPLAQEIIGLHGGKLIVESEIGKGSRFCVELPFEKPRILIVDDERDFRFLINHYLKKIDAEIIEAENGLAAMEAIGVKKPHIVITDIEMPEMGGLELLRTIKKSKDLQAIPVIVVSGRHGAEVREEVFKLGGSDFATKDIDIDDFVPRVKRFIS